jgi:hypothetical protein
MESLFDKKSLKEFVETLISSFDKYGDDMILSYESTKLKAAQELLPDLTPSEREEILRTLEDYLKSPKPVKKSVFVSSKNVEVLKKIADNYEGKGVRIPSLGEKILLALNLYRFLRERKQKVDLTDLGALTGILADILYLFWLYKEGFSRPDKLKSYIEDLLKVALKTANNPVWVKEKTIEFILPVWAGLEQRTSLVEQLAQEDLDRRAEELAKQYIFGSEENYQKMLEIIERMMTDLVREKPKNLQEWIKKEIQKFE